MAKVWMIKDSQGVAYGFNCPACNMLHIIPISYKQHHSTKNGRPKPTWKFNSDLDEPTFQPDFKIVWAGHQPPQTCHFIIRDGEIIFLIESTHPMSGQRVPMVDVV